jgi:ribonuclease P protein component
MSRPKNEVLLRRLKNRAALDALFERGQVFRSKYLLLRFEEDPRASFLFAGVSVSKRNFKKAVDRNLIKRQLREGLRAVKGQNLFFGNCILIYTGKKSPKTSSLLEETTALFLGLNKKIRPFLL